MGPAKEHAPTATAPQIDPAEAELVQRARGGDRAALGELLRQEQGRVFNLCLRMVGSRADAGDAAQEAMLKAIGAIERFEGASRFGTWLTRIAINECYTLLRRRQRRSMASLDAPRNGDADTGARYPDPADPEPGPDQRVQQHEQTRIALETLQTLDPDHRAILVLRDLQGLDYADIAEALDLKRGTVKSRLFRARLALRAAIEARTAGPAPASRPATPDEAAP
ncbi:MAG: RNA polymerase sigma factor [Planctomycetota bacterium]